MRTPSDLAKSSKIGSSSRFSEPDTIRNVLPPLPRTVSAPLSAAVSQPVKTAAAVKRASNSAVNFRSFIASSLGWAEYPSFCSYSKGNKRAFLPRQGKGQVRTV